MGGQLRPECILADLRWTSIRCPKLPDFLGSADRIAHNASPIRVDIDSRPSTVLGHARTFAQESGQQGRAASKAATPSRLRELISLWGGWPTVSA
jgi:hypothetical protein